MGPSRPSADAVPRRGRHRPGPHDPGVGRGRSGQPVAYDDHHSGDRLPRGYVPPDHRCGSALPGRAGRPAHSNRLSARTRRRRRRSRRGPGPAPRPRSDRGNADRYDILSERQPLRLRRCRGRRDKLRLSSIGPAVPIGSGTTLAIVIIVSGSDGRCLPFRIRSERPAQSRADHRQRSHAGPRGR